DDNAQCLRCRKQYFYETTDSGKQYRYFTDKEKETQILLKDADYEEFAIPPGMWLYGVKHPITREYKCDIIAKDAEDARRKTGWDLSEIPYEMPVHTIPLKKGPDIKAEVTVKEESEKKERKKKVVEKTLKKVKREGPSLKDVIIEFTKTLKPINKDKFVKGVHKILIARMTKENKTVDKDHLLKRSKLYWSMYGKGVSS
ncbi:hypothetical protein LCGC14_2574850, partial [marine sediment metagenome]